MSLIDDNTIKLAAAAAEREIASLRAERRGLAKKIEAELLNHQEFEFTKRAKGEVEVSISDAVSSLINDAAAEVERLRDAERIAWLMRQGLEGYLDGVFAEYDSTEGHLIHVDGLWHHYDPDNLTDSDRAIIDAARGEGK